MAKAQILALGETLSGSDDVATVAQELESLVSAREQAAAEQGDDDEGGEDDEGDGEDDVDDRDVGAKVDEIKEMLEGGHEDFVNIKPTGKCGVCLYNGVVSHMARNGSYGCFTCNVRVCWHPDCLRDHLTRKRGKEAKGEMKREERKPASGESKSHFREDDDE